MDNVCHTLVGAALARAGLKGRSALATATLVIGANLPDLDVLAIPLGHGIGWRRGLTHGIPALLVWPFVLAAVMVGWARWRGVPGDRPVVPGWLLGCAAIAVWSHPVLDYLNVYGIRWLMPLSGRWFYGDSLFIVDPWLLLLLGLGILWSRRVEKAGRADWPRPARVALGIASLYIGGMIATTVVARTAVAATEAGDPVATGKLVVAPVPVNPFRKQIISDRGTFYRLGTYRVLPWPELVWNERIEKGPIHDSSVIAAARTPRAAEFLDWARMPVARIVEDSGRVVVQFYDLRYSSGRPDDWASIVVAPGS